MKHELKPVPNLEGLVYCTVCDGAEGELTTDCPGVKMTREMRYAVVTGSADYKDGKWQLPKWNSPSPLHITFVSNEIDEERKLFEDSMYAHYLAQRAKGRLLLLEGDAPEPHSREMLFERDAQTGDYMVIVYQAAWGGWQAAKGML